MFASSPLSRCSALTACIALSLSGCMGDDAPQTTATPAAAVPNSSQYVYDCSGTLYAVDQMDDAVYLHFPDHGRRLNADVSASGARYSDGRVVFWSKGNEATLEYGGQTQDCILQPGISPWERADLRGVSFRGIGQEPGWYVEVSPGRNILFVGDYGDITVTAPVPPAITEPGRNLTEYYAMSGDTELSLRIEATPCTDTMSGEAFEATVRVRYGEKEYQGCGRSL